MRAGPDVSGSKIAKCFGGFEIYKSLSMYRYDKVVPISINLGVMVYVNLYFAHALRVLRDVVFTFRFPNLGVVGRLYQAGRVSGRNRVWRPDMWFFV